MMLHSRWGTIKIHGVNWNGDSETMPAADVPVRSAWIGITARQPSDHADFGGPLHGADVPLVQDNIHLAASRSESVQHTTCSHRQAAQQYRCEQNSHWVLDRAPDQSWRCRPSRSGVGMHQ